MIFYKSLNRKAPSWMREPHQRYYRDDFVYCDMNPQSWPNIDDEFLALDDTEHDAANPDKGVSYYSLGKFTPQPREHFNVGDLRYIKTPCGSSVPVYPALDRAGGVWIVPIILNDEGPTLGLEWSMVNGVIERKPSDMQRDIIVTCESIREAFLSDEGLASLPLKLAAHACGMILAYSYHVHHGEFIKHRILDDHLVARVLMASVGFGTPEHQVEPEGSVPSLESEFVPRGD